MVTGTGESAPVNESDAGEEVLSGVSDMESESRIDLGCERFPDSSKVLILFFPDMSLVGS